MEEQLKEAETRRASDIKDEEKRKKECLFKVEKTKNEEIELLAAQYDLEDENSKIKTQLNQTQKMIDTLNADKRKLEERLAQEVQRYHELVLSRFKARHNLVGLSET